MALSASLTSVLTGVANAQTVVFAETFSDPVPLGAWSDCQHDVDTPTAWCGGLSGRYRADWWAYPSGWPDTATQRGYPVGGYYDPEHTVWVSDGSLHIRLFRDGGPVHSVAVVPKPLMSRLYGWYEERFRVVKPASGYKSAHLLWPSSGKCANCEIDFPEAEWTRPISAYSHPKDRSAQDVHMSGESWASWHTSRIEWTRNDVKFYLDGQLVGTSTKGVPDVPMTWILQNESALDGSEAAPNSWAQMDIDFVRGGTYD